MMEYLLKVSSRLIITTTAPLVERGVVAYVGSTE